MSDKPEIKVIARNYEQKHTPRLAKFMYALDAVMEDFLDGEATDEEIQTAVVYLKQEVWMLTAPGDDSDDQSPIHTLDVQL